MPLFNLDDATPNSVAQFGASIIRLDSVMSMDFSWNHEVNESSSVAYIVEVLYDCGIQKNYSCSKNELSKFLLYLDNINYLDGKFNIVSIDGFIESLHKKYYDLKTYQKIAKNNHSETFLDEDE